MDWLSFIGSILGGLVGGLFTFIGVKLTLSHEDKRRKEEFTKESIKMRPRLEIISYKNIHKDNFKRPGDLNVLVLHIEEVDISNKKINFIYDNNALNNEKLVCVEYTFKNIGFTEIEDISIVCSHLRDTSIIEMNQRDLYISNKLINPEVWSNKRYIKPGQTISMKFFFLESKISVGIISPLCYICLKDINGKFWHQPLLVPKSEIENSSLMSYENYKNSVDIDIVLKCFKGELPW